MHAKKAEGYFVIKSGKVFGYGIWGLLKTMTNYPWPISCFIRDVIFKGIKK